jgi:hypothetical protein
MTAMVKTLGFRANREQKLKILFRELVKELRYWIEEKPLGEHEDNLWDDIFIPAARLHRSIKCSTRDYILKWAEATRNQFPKKASPWTLKNIQTWRTVSYNALDESYRVFHGLAPGLFRCEVGDEADLELVKPVVVIYKREQQRSIPPSPSPTRGKTRDADNPPDIKDVSPKRQSYSERSNDSISFSSLKNIFGPKKKHSESKQKQPKSHAERSRPKSTTGRHHSRTKSGKKKQSSPWWETFVES